MPRLRKKRVAHTTFKLVHPSYEDQNYGETNEAIWVKESDLRRNARGDAAKLEKLALAADVPPQRRRRVHFGEQNEEGDDAEWVDGEYDEEEGEWCDDDEEWEEEEEDTEVYDTRFSQQGGRSNDGAYSQKLMGEWGDAEEPAWLKRNKPRHMLTEEELEALRLRETEEYKNKRNMLMAHDEEGAGDEDKLFEDEVECEVTDDFLHQLVFGSGDGNNDVEEGEEGGEEGDDEEWGDDDFGMDEEEDGEVWRLLTEEEREAIRASRHRGTARRRHMKSSSGAGEDMQDYLEHDVTRRALDRQFTEMMREFNVDARLNDAYTDDPRAHGPLSMDKYMSALEEFVVDRAGVDMETAEPHKNKGLIQQLKYLSHRAGVFDTDRNGGVFVTTLLPDKQARFVEEYRRETDNIRREAKLRILRKLIAERQASGKPVDASVLEAATLAAQSYPHATASAHVQLQREGEEKEDYIIKEVRTKADRMDCETVVSAYSTYYNQPNVIKAPPSKKAAASQQQRRGNGKRRGRVAAYDDEDDYYPNCGGAHESVDESEHGAPAHVVVTVRPTDETSEEKKLRRQAVKAAQRERRQEKSNLKKAYKTVEAEEVKRATVSQNARRTVHFV